MTKEMKPDISAMELVNFLDIPEATKKSILKNLSTETIDEIGSMETSELEQRLLSVSLELEAARKELEATPAYIEAKEALKTLNSAFSDLSKPMKLQIKLITATADYLSNQPE